MSAGIIGFVIGILIGCMLGVSLACMCVIGKRGQEEIREDVRKKDEQ